MSFFSQRVALTYTMAAIGLTAVMAGFVVGFVLRDTGHSTSALPVVAATSLANADDFMKAKYPDNTLDACVWIFDGAAAAPNQAFIDALESIDAARAGLALNVARLGKSAKQDCDGRPDAAPIVARERVVEGQSPMVFLPVAASLALRELPEGDLYVFLVPQALAESVGNAWGDRFKPYHVRTDEGTGAEVTKAVLIGDEEAADPEMLRRLVAVGLGLAGGRNGLRPFIDGRCLKPGSDECGSEVGE